MGDSRRNNLVMNEAEASTAAALVTDTNVVLQVNRSHLDRMVDFLTSFSSSPSYSSSTDNTCSEVGRDLVVRIVATKKSTASKSCSLLFLHVDSSSSDNTLLKQSSSSVLGFLEDMTKRYDYVLRGLNKIYVMTSIEEESSSRSDDVCVRSIIQGRLESSSSLLDEGCWDNFIDRKLLNILEKLKQRTCYSSQQSSSTAVVVVKVDVFPMKLQHQMISNITKLLNDKCIPEDELDISPTNYTHTLSIVQIDNAEQHTNKHNNKSKANVDSGCHGTFLVGLTNHIIPQKIYSSELSASNDDDIICRAHRKLEEVFHRWYRTDDGSVGDNIVTTKKEDIKSFSFLSKTSSVVRGRVIAGNKRRCPLIAVDCGSAPGGWTKFLAEHACFDVIYSIDPAEMDKRVSSLPVVEHLQMTSEDAIPHLCHILSSSPSSPSCGGGGQVSLPVDEYTDDNKERDFTGVPVTDDAMTTTVQQQQQQKGGCVNNRNECKQISLWVSDMCLHEYTNQVDTLLRLRDMGMTCPMNNCAFVLTLKFCNAGHGRGRYDELAMEEACRLKVAGAIDVKVMHLFSNRLSERTLVGFI